MSGNDRWNVNVFSCRRKDNTDGADCPSSGRVFQKMKLRQETSDGRHRLLTDGTVGRAAAEWTTTADSYGLAGLIPERVDSSRRRRRSFFIAAPVVWNSLPLHHRFPSISRSQFLAGLKTHLFRLAFHWLFLWELLKRFNWTELNWKSAIISSIEECTNYSRSSMRNVFKQLKLY